MLKWKFLVLVKFQKCNVQQCRVLALQHRLFGWKQAGSAFQYLSNVLLAFLELFADEFVTGPLTFNLAFWGFIFLFVVGSFQPIAFYGIAQIELIVLQVELTAELVYFCFSRVVFRLRLSKMGMEIFTPICPSKLSRNWFPMFCPVPVIWLSDRPAVRLMVGE